MISKRWRAWLTYAAMSVFVAWHAFVLMVAPLPDGSALAQALRPLLHPYLTLLYLDSKWDFYAPQAGIGHQLRYDIEDATGNRHFFVPTDALSWFHPDFWWFRAWYDVVMDYPETYADHVAALLCRKHARLQPVSINLLRLQVENFSPNDQLNGKQPLDPEFATVTTVKHVVCPAR